MVNLGKTLLVGAGLVAAFLYLRSPRRTPDGRFLDGDANGRAAAAARRGVAAARFVFDADDARGATPYGEATVTDPKAVAEVVDALENASRDPGPTGQTVEPGSEAEDADKIELVPKDGGDPEVFRVIEGDIDDKWGPKIRELYDRYRAVAFPKPRRKPG